jgi:hypothetical protein
MSEAKKRPRYFTAALVTVMILNLWGAWSSFFSSSFRALTLSHYPATPDWVFPAWAICHILEFMAWLAVFFWKKWGFFVLLFSTVLAFIIRLEAGSFPASRVFNPLFAGALLLLLLFKWGKPNLWSQLE